MGSTVEVEVARGPSVLQVARAWPVVVVLGLLTIVLGVVVLSWPQETLTVISVLLGIHLIIFGVFRLLSAFAVDAFAPWMSGFLGIVGILAGVVVLRHPFESIAVLAAILGAIWIVVGAIDLISAIADRDVEQPWLQALVGVVSIAAGIVVAVWPAPTVTVIAWVAGFYLIVFGLFGVVQGFQLRGLTKT